MLAGLVDLLGELVEESAILQALTPATTATPTLDSQVCHKKVHYIKLLQISCYKEYGFSRVAGATHF